MSPDCPLEQVDSPSIATESARQRIERLGRENNVSYVPDALDELANKFAELSDSEVTLDDPQNLLVALRRANLLSSKEMTDLHVRYIKESGGR